MFPLVTLMIVFASSEVMVSSILSKPYYELENAENLFSDFINQYKKSYDHNEYSQRLEIFKENLNEINLRNAKHPQTIFKINQFADLARKERQQYSGIELSNDKREKLAIPDSSDPAPDKLDWRDKGLVTHVKDQMSCGSCYIFSAIGNIEGQYAKKYNKTLAFSEGQSLDCLDSGSCSGGIVHEIMQDLAKSPGLMLEDDYGYMDNKTTCKEDAKKVVAHVRGGSEIHIPDEDTLKQKLADIGPLSVVMNSDDLDFYNGGILHPDLCTGRPPKHGMLLVGYGEDKNGTKYWIIKNSWGTVWGEQGYVRLLRGVNACQMGTSYTATAEIS